MVKIWFVLCLAGLSASAGWFGGGRESAPKVRLWLSTETWEPTSTLELRFEDPVVAEDAVGSVPRVSPLVVQPPLAGKFTWVSRSSGLFTPTECPQLGQAYRFRLQPGLRNVDGTALDVRLDVTLRTPDFALLGHAPESPSGNIAVLPTVTLQFNEDVNTNLAPRYLSFHNPKGGRVPAEVRCAASRWEGWFGGETRTWREGWPATNVVAMTAIRRGYPTAPPLPIGNRLVVYPARPLSVGEAWTLEVEKGLPTVDGKLRLAKSVSVILGDVQPFAATGVSARNFLNKRRELHLDFSKPVAGHAVISNTCAWIVITPARTNLEYELAGHRMVIRGDFELGTNYAVTVKAGLPAGEAQTLVKDVTETVAFEPLTPRVYLPAFSGHQLSGGRRDVEFLALNLDRVTVRAKRLDRQTLIHALRGYQSYFKRHGSVLNDEYADTPYREVDFNVVAGKTIYSRDITTGGALDHALPHRLSWDEILGKQKFGAVFLDAEGQRQQGNFRAVAGAQCLVQVTDLGLLWKHNGQEFAVWAFSYATGRPVSGATVELMTEENESLAQAVTDATGFARLPAKEGQWLLAQNGDDLHAEHLTDNQLNLPLYRLNLPYGYGPEPTRKAFLFSDRPLYQPGETVYFKAIVRDLPDGQPVLPINLKGVVNGYDSRGRRFVTTNVTVSALGALDLALVLPPAPLGTYRLDLVFTNEATFSHHFEVAEYQPNAFEVKIQHPPVFKPTDKVELPVTARYYHGTPLAKAKLRWLLEANDAGFSPEGFEEFQFIDSGYRWWRHNDRGEDQGSLSLQGEHDLTSQGVTLQPAFTLNPKQPQPRQARVTVEITDLNQQTVSREAGFTVHSSDFYLGVHETEQVWRSGEEHPLELIAVRGNGQPLEQPVAVSVKVIKLEWETVRVQGAGKATLFRNERRLRTIAEKSIATRVLRRAGAQWELPDAKAAPAPTLLIQEAGEYVLEYRARDAAGQDVLTRQDVQVTGNDAVNWEQHNPYLMKLIPDQVSYKVGDTATILVKTPYDGPALVTVEREKVLRHFTVDLKGTAPAVQIPLTEADLPNVFVSVTLLRGYERTRKQVKLPEYRLGYCQLTLEPLTRLQVKVASATSEYQPRQTVAVHADVKDAQGQPVADAEVTLYAVDEGVLSLAGFVLPNPHDCFYSQRPLSVQTSISLPNLLPENPDAARFSNKGYLIGGGGEEAELRKKFLACAFWNATLRTDAGGKVTASFPAPDGLTRYRIVAVVQTAKHQFGAGEGAFAIHKPLMLQPSLPLFGSQGDSLTARAVVQNESDRAGDVEVSLQLDDKAAAGTRPLVKSVHLAARQSAKVEFDVTLTGVGASQWIWRAHFQDPALAFTDSVQSTIQISDPRPVLREVFYARITGAETNLLAKADPRLLDSRGTVTVRVSNTRLLGLDGAVEHLLHYPYGCVEQTTSSLLPWLALRDLPGMSQRLKRGNLNAETAIIRSINRLLSMQTASGGLSYWPGGGEADAWGSAYGAMGLLLAKQAGYDVPNEPLERLLKFLSEQLREAGTAWEDHALSARCLALYALALADKPEPAYGARLFEKRNTLSAENRALLALALARAHGGADMIEELLKVPSAPRRETFSWFGCLAREQAIQLMAWCQHDPRAAQIETLLAELLAEMQDGHWATTQGNAWSVLALAEYARQVEKTLAPVSGELVCGDATRRFTTTAAETIVQEQFAWTPAGSHALTLRKAGAQTLYALTTIEVRLKTLEQPRQNHGFSLVRTYSLLDDLGTPRPFANAKVGDRVLVTLNLEVPQASHYLAIEDPLPAILEPVNPNFVTRQTAVRGTLQNDFQWYGDFQEMKADRVRYFRNNLWPGQFKIQYLARVRAAGTVIAPCAKVEEMYRPNRMGLTEAIQLKSTGWE